MSLNRYFTDEEMQWFLQTPNLYQKCFFLVSRLFGERIDKSGAPYINHLLFVADSLDDEYEKCAGLLHDTLEDIPDITSDDLLKIGIPEEVLAIVELVTKQPDEAYSSFIDRIIASENDGALRVKFYDMQNNSDPERLKKLDEEIRRKLENKYSSQKMKLERVLRERKINI